ncbi:hypothetical protein, partial [Geitlerinema sp. PCC 9228]|uniref:hypothetical protein n=1 Tax=Geitlerinema sp. PCC 9228 TaxID=111611 RepID=UPI0008F9A01C
MTLKIYIKSRGTHAENDYCWKNQNDAVIATPKPIEAIREFIQSDSRSVVLQQTQEIVLLLVTGIESGRKDYRGRHIRNSIAWIGNSQNREQDRKKLQKLAASALRNKLDDCINHSITEEGGNFKVLGEEISKIENNFSQTLSLRSPDKENLTPKICQNTDKSRKELANELETVDLAKNFLVVVTGNKSEETLKQAGVWRGVSNLIPYQEWQKYQSKKLNRVSLLAIVIGSVAILVIFVIFIVFLLTSDTQDLETPPSEETPQETVEPESSSLDEKTPQETVEAESTSPSEKTPQETVEPESS